MNGPRGQHDQDTETYRMPVHRRVARVRRSWWAVVAASLLGVAGAVALIIVAGTGGATADVPAALQVGAQAAPSTVATVPSTVATAPSTGVTTPPTTLAPTTVAAPAGGGSTDVPTTEPATTAPSTTSTPPSTTSSTTTSAPFDTTTTPTTTTTSATPTTTVSAPLTIVIPKSKVTEGSDGSAGSDDGSRTTNKVGDN